MTCLLTLVVTSMRDESVKSYSAPMPINKPVQTLTVGEVLRSDHDNYKVGQTVRGLMYMSEYIVLSGAYLGAMPAKVIELGNLSATKFLGACGMPGSTSHWSYHEIGQPKKGETIFGRLNAESPPNLLHI